MRLIDADELITMQLHDENDRPVGPRFVPAQFIENAPIIEAEPIKYGRWIEDEYGIPHCSECKAINNTVYKNYCPNCGARMEENDG